MISESIKNLLEERKAMREKIRQLEVQNDKLRQQLDAANAHIQLQNSIIAGDVE